jgi:hypothetical protein
MSVTIWSQQLHAHSGVALIFDWLLLLHLLMLDLLLDVSEVFFDDHGFQNCFGVFFFGVKTKLITEDDDGFRLINCCSLKIIIDIRSTLEDVNFFIKWLFL